MNYSYSISYTICIFYQSISICNIIGSAICVLDNALVVVVVVVVGGGGGGSGGLVCASIDVVSVLEGR